MTAGNHPLRHCGLARDLSRSTLGRFSGIDAQGAKAVRKLFRVTLGGLFFATLVFGAFVLLFCALALLLGQLPA